MSTKSHQLAKCQASAKCKTPDTEKKNNSKTFLIYNHNKISKENIEWHFSGQWESQSAHFPRKLVWGFGPDSCRLQLQVWSVQMETHLEVYCWTLSNVPLISMHSSTGGPSTTAAAVFPFWGAQCLHPELGPWPKVSRDN